MSDDIWIFGYGSLVNVDTHGYPDVHGATLRGWRRDWRVWNAGPNRHSTVLTIESCAATRIDGLIARVPFKRWDALRDRESGYRFFDLPAEHLDHRGPKDVRVVTFQSLSDMPGRDENPIAQSYLDCVLKGFAALHGPDALQTFFDTTDGWHTPVIRDRDRPLYRRAVTLSDAEKATFDDLATKNGVRFV